MMVRALIIGPHPDDSELAMGGSIAKMTDTGWEVTLVDLTNGEPTPFGSRELRAKEAMTASKVLGIQRRMCLDMPNRYLLAKLENRRKLAEVIRTTQPDIIFGPVLPDDHPDHAETGKLVEAARFEAKLCKTDMTGTPHWVPKYFKYYSTHRCEYDKPSFIVDVTDYWDKKIEAVRAYESQIKNISPPNDISLLDKIEVTGRYFGQCIGRKYGEPFVAHEPMVMAQLVHLTGLG